MTVFSNDRVAIAWVVGTGLPRVHALLDEAIYAQFARFTRPIAYTSAPTVLVGWGLQANASSAYAPSLPAVVEMVIPGVLQTGGSLTQHAQWRRQGTMNVGWEVLEAKISGVWQTFTTASAALAAQGLQWLEEPEPDDPNFEQWLMDMDAAEAAEQGTHTLSALELTQLDTAIDAAYNAAGISREDLLAAHLLGNARTRHLQRLLLAEAP